MVTNLFFAMSLAGSTVFLLYMLVSVFAKNYVSLRWRYRMLKIAAAFYLLPIPNYKFYILQVVALFYPGVWDKVARLYDDMDKDCVLLVGSDFVQFSVGYKRTLVFVGLIWIVSVVLMHRRIRQYQQWKTACGIGAKLPTDREQEIFLKVKNETGIKKKVRFICSQHCSSPMVSGIISPVLIVPLEGGMEKQENYEYIFKHELVHIKHHDLFIRYLGLLVMSLHWFNPFVYLMFHEISVISEMYCDSMVVKGKGEEARREYGELILTLAAHKKEDHKETLFSNMVNSRSKHMYRRRILEMKRHTKQKAVLSAVLTGLICISGVMTVFAYKTPMVVSGIIERGSCDDIWFIPESEEEPEEELVSDYYFTADSGKVYDLTNPAENQRTECSHNFSIPGTVKKHERDGKGGCSIKTYDALRCSKCSERKIVKLNNVVTYMICPHS